jgi:hypothetical protein
MTTRIHCRRCGFRCYWNLFFGFSDFAESFFYPVIDGADLSDLETACDLVVDAGDLWMKRNLRRTTML